MVTASAPVAVDPHAPVAATAQTTTAAVPASGTFQSIYQNLPTGDGPANLSQLLANSKDASAKRNPKSIDDQLTALLAQNVDSPLRHPWAPPSLSLSTAAPAPTAKELAQSALPSEEALAQSADPSAQTGAISSVVGLQASLQEAAGKTTQIIAPGKHMPARVALPNFGLADGRHIGLIPVPAQLAGQTPALPQVAGADGKQPQEETLRGAIGSAMAQHAAEAIHSIDKGIAASLGPRSESLAFSLRLVETVAAGKRVQAAAQAEAPRGQSHNDSKNEEQTPAAATDATSTIRGEPLTNASGDVAARATSTSSNEPVMLPQVEIRPEVAMTQQRETSHTSAPAAIHEIQPITPEVPRVPATSEILLQLGSKEQPASIRVSDRGGAVNVTVHAADPDLRSSLRSNLGDLASQLSHQGWKAEVVKSGTVLTRTETPQDPGHDGQRSSGQQHSFTQGERQQSRDRRTNSNEWLSEFEEQTSGNAGGGK